MERTPSQAINVFECGFGERNKTRFCNFFIRSDFGLVPVSIPENPEIVDTVSTFLKLGLSFIKVV